MTPIDPTISIIVPVHDSAAYLRPCLDSLVGQSFRDIEIICVDDGSTDDSPAILQEYASQDPRVVVITQPFRGVATARNTALAHATAPFIMSCDSDDFYDLDMCRIMHETILREDVDVVVCGWNIIFEIPEALKKDVEEHLRLKYVGTQPITWQKIINTDVSLCNKIFRRSLIDKYDIRFPDGLLFEDAYFNDAYMVVAETAYYLDEPLYNYIRHKHSVMSNAFMRSGTASDYLQILFRTHEYLTKHGLFDQFRDFFWHRAIQYYSFAHDNLTGDDRDQVRELARRFVKTHRSELNGVTPRIRLHFLSMVDPTARARWQVRSFLQRVFNAADPYYRSQVFVAERADWITAQQDDMRLKLTQIGRDVETIRAAAERQR